MQSTTSTSTARKRKKEEEGVEQGDGQAKCLLSSYIGHVVGVFGCLCEFQKE